MVTKENRIEKLSSRLGNADAVDRQGFQDLLSLELLTPLCSPPSSRHSCKYDGKHQLVQLVFSVEIFFKFWIQDVMGWHT